jgi:hypothetical protein
MLETTSGSPCRWNQQIGPALARFSNEYSEIEKRPSIEKLVMLDGKIRRFFNSRPEYYPCENEIKFWKDEHKKMGIYSGHWDVLVYTEELLIAAHQMNPNSKFRSYTLFSSIMGVISLNGMGEMPDIKSAYRYEREFPYGPFIEETLSIIGNFNKDLYMVLRDKLNDYKYDCFKPYINRSPRITQSSRARQNAIIYYEKVLSINPSNARARRFLEEVTNRTVKSWSFCAD